MFFIMCLFIVKPQINLDYYNISTDYILSIIGITRGGGNKLTKIGMMRGGGAPGIFILTITGIYIVLMIPGSNFNRGHSNEEKN